MAEPVKISIKKEVHVIDLSSPCSSCSDISSWEEEGTPMRPIVCLKKIEDVKRYEEIDDCFILDFDPTQSIDVSKLSVSNDDADDLSVIAETGKVACRDYPHSRHLCVKFPFNTTSHETHCALCFCYVCDSAAPCEDWTKPDMGHCHASEKVGSWSLMRNLKKQQNSLIGLA